MSYSNHDVTFMNRALALARRGVGLTSPNPAVGAVVVRGGRVVGQGYHRKAGGPHAEVEALARCGRQARGATLYVTLEPCCTWGRTPPCTDAIVAAGIKRVVVAARDPNPRHDGTGLQVLRRAGIKVDQGLMAVEAADLNAAFNKWIVGGMPLVTAKVAASLDGRIATRTGDSKWITSEASRREVHRMRVRCDAVMVSAGTVRADDPALTVRHGVRGRQPWRVVVDGRGRTPLSARLYTDMHKGRTIVLTTKHSSARWRKALEGQGVAVELVKADGQHVNLKAALKALGQRQLTSVLVEGGGDMLGAMLAEGLVDRLVYFVAPIIIGGVEAKPSVGGRGAMRIADAIRLREVRCRKVGESDWMVSGVPLVGPSRQRSRKGAKARR